MCTKTPQSYRCFIKIWAVFLLFCLPSIQIWAQENTLLNEEFVNNSNHWPIGDYAGYTTTLEGGKLVFFNKDATYTHYVLKEIYVNPKEDFIIGCKLRILGNETYGNGLVWGARDGYRKTFCITNNGYFRIASAKRAEEEVEVDYTTSPHIYTNGQFNSIAIAKKGNLVIYFINGKVVHQGVFDRIYGIGHGLMLGSERTEVESFIIKHPPVKIEVGTGMALAGKKENLGPNINSYCGEISPKVSADGKTLFVCRGWHQGNMGTNDQDAWISTRIGDDAWGPLQNMGAPVNDEKQNSIASVAPDQNTILINYDGRDDPGLMRSVRTASGWAALERVQIDNFYNDNVDAEFALAPDNKVMVYSVERKDSYGEKDLYVSFLKPDGSWTSPKNMGPVLNSFTTDFGPFVAADGKTLYFASMGHPGYGSADVFVSKRLDDSWTNWSPPKNLGPGINTADWDAYYTVTASGEEAYMSGAGEYGSTDIFRIKMAKEVRPEAVVLIKGRVFDQKTKKPLSASIAYENLKNGKEIGIATANPRTGEYQIVLPYGFDYGFQAASKGYVAVSEHIDLTIKGGYTEITRDLYLAPLSVGQTVVMQNVFFERATAALLPTSYPELDRIAKLLKDNPSLYIKIKGHTDNLGTASSLLKVSKLRAAAVRSYLASKGVEAARMQEEGLGGAFPIANNDNPEERAKNRRVEFEILKY